MKIYLNLSGVAEKLGMSHGYLRQLKMQDKLPEPDAMTGPVAGWLPETVDTWQETRVKGLDEWKREKLKADVDRSTDVG